MDSMKENKENSILIPLSDKEEDQKRNSSKKLDRQQTLLGEVRQPPSDATIHTLAPQESRLDKRCTKISTPHGSDDRTNTETNTGGNPGNNVSIVMSTLTESSSSTVDITSILQGFIDDQAMAWEQKWEKDKEESQLAWEQKWSIREDEHKKCQLAWEQKWAARENQYKNWQSEWEQKWAARENQYKNWQSEWEQKWAAREDQIKNWQLGWEQKWKGLFDKCKSLEEQIILMRAITTNGEMVKIFHEYLVTEYEEQYPTLLTHPEPYERNLYALRRHINEQDPINNRGFRLLIEENRIYCEEKGKEFNPTLRLSYLQDFINVLHNVCDTRNKQNHAKYPGCKNHSIEEIGDQLEAATPKKNKAAHDTVSQIAKETKEKEGSPTHA